MSTGSHSASGPTNAANALPQPLASVTVESPTNTIRTFAEVGTSTAARAKAAPSEDGR